MIADAVASFKEGFARGISGMDDSSKLEESFEEVADRHKYATENELALEFKEALGLGEVYIATSEPDASEINVNISTVIDNKTGKVVYKEDISNLISFKKDKEGYIKLSSSVLTGRFSDFEVMSITDIMDKVHIGPEDRNKLLVRDTHLVDKKDDYIFVLVDGNGSYSNQTIIGPAKKGLLIRLNDEKI